MNLKLDDGIEEEYNYVKKAFQTKVNEGYRKSEIIELKIAGLSDDDIFIAEMLGLTKGLIEAGFGEYK